MPARTTAQRPPAAGAAAAFLSDALESLTRLVEGASAPTGTPLFDALLTNAGEERPGEGTLDRLVRRVLLSMLEERATRHPPTRG